MKKFVFILLILAMVLCCVSCSQENDETEFAERHFQVYSADVDNWLTVAKNVGFADIEVEATEAGCYSITALVPQKYSNADDFFRASKAFGSLTELRFEVEYLLPKMPVPISGVKLMVKNSDCFLLVGTNERIYHVWFGDELRLNLGQDLVWE